MRRATNGRLPTVLVVLAAAAASALAHTGGRCPTGVSVSSGEAQRRERLYHATILRRYGADSAQAKAFVPAAALPAALQAAAELGPDASGPAAAVPDALQALTQRALDWRQSKSSGGGGGGEAVNGDALVVSRAQQQGKPQQPPPPKADPPAINVGVRWHRITYQSQGSYPDSWITAQIETLNAKYNPWGFSFTLDYVNTTESYLYWSTLPGLKTERMMKSALRGGGAEALNVYTTGMSTSKILGWSSVPFEYSGSPDLDGVVIKWDTLPGGTAPFNLGYTLVHEVGHWLGLYHTFQNKCLLATEVGMSGDFVSDTPAEKLAAFGCPTGRNTCPGQVGELIGKDPVRNFMDYSHDECMTSFTAGQAARMTGQWAAFRQGR